MSQHDETAVPGDDSASSPGTAVLALIVTVTFVLVAYPGIGLFREIFGQHGVALSPLLYSAVLFPVLFLAISVEGRVQAASWWPRVRQVWYWGAAIIGVGLPLVIGLLWPLAVGTGLPAGLPTIICAAPLPLVFYGIRAYHKRGKG